MAELPLRPTLADLQADMARLVKERGWDRNSLSDEYLMFVEEVGELAKEIRRHERMHIEAGASREPDLEGELADVFNYVLNLANKLEIDLEQAYRRKMKITVNREWR